VPVALFQRIAEHHRHPATDTLLHAVGFYANFYSGLYPHVAQVHALLWARCAGLCVPDPPPAFGTETGRLRVAAVNGLAQGETVLRRKRVDYPQAGWDERVGDTTVCMQVQADLPPAAEAIEQTLLGPWLTR